MTNEEPSPLEIIRLGKDEMNLAEFPITLLTDRVPKGKTVLRYKDRIYDEKTGKHLTRTLTISANEVDGLPTAVDDDVILGLIQLTKQTNNFTSREVEFSRLELIKLLGWPDSGQSYRRLKLSLARWLSVTLLYENAWRDNNKGTWLTKGFHILDNFELNDTRTTTEQGGILSSKIIWNKVVQDSFESGYLKSINYGLYVKLKHAISRRLYRFLSKRMYYGPEMMFDLRDLAFAHVGISDNYSGNAGKIKEKMRPAIEELEAVGFLEPLSKEDRYRKQGKDWQIRLVARMIKPAAAPAAIGDLTSEPVDPPLVARLVERNVTKSTAFDLAKRYPERIEPQMEFLDFLTLKKPKKIGDPAAYLVRAIERNNAAPPDFKSAADLQKVKEAKQACEQKEAEKSRRDRQQKAKDHAKDKRDLAYWESLATAQKAALQAKADGEADPGQLAKESGSWKSMGQRIRREEYIRRLLDAQESGDSGESS